jgi:hypothetical protein
LMSNACVTDGRKTEVQDIGKRIAVKTSPQQALRLESRENYIRVASLTLLMPNTSCPISAATNSSHSTRLFSTSTMNINTVLKAALGNTHVSIVLKVIDNMRCSLGRKF